jgi:hypothetical protein
LAGIHDLDSVDCWRNKSSKLDDCEFIWKEFSNLNYITALVEDAPGLATFNHGKTGFVIPPTDYYLRPLMVADAQDEEFPPGHKGARCIGGLQPTAFVSSYTKDFSIRVGSSYPSFLMSWFTSVSHGDFNGIKVCCSVFLPRTP